MRNKLMILLAGVLTLAACDAVKQAATQVANEALTNAGAQPNLQKLTADEASSGLKEALVQGIMNGTGNLGKAGAFLNSSSLKIPLPPDVQAVEKKIRDNRLLNSLIGGELDKAVVAMNTGAEKSMALATPVFKKAIVDMSFTDAMKILTGGNGAATSYLKTSSESQLMQLFMPEVKKSLDAVELSKIWNPVVTQINKNKLILGLNKNIEPDLNLYVTQKATSALFSEIENEENKIRKDPVSRSSDILKKAFDYADKNK